MINRMLINKPKSFSDRLLRIIWEFHLRADGVRLTTEHWIIYEKGKEKVILLNFSSHVLSSTIFRSDDSRTKSRDWFPVCECNKCWWQLWCSRDFSLLDSWGQRWILVSIIQISL